MTTSLGRACASFLCALVLASCGLKVDGESQDQTDSPTAAKLTKEQQQQFWDLNASAERTIRAAEYASQGQRGMVDSDASSSSSSASMDGKVFTMTKRLMDSRCAINAWPTSGSASGGLVPSGLIVTGSACPIELKYQEDWKTRDENNPKGAHIEHSVTYSYEVRDPSYLPLNDIQSIQLSGAEESGGPIGQETRIIYIGSAKSQLHGYIGISVSGKIAHPKGDQGMKGQILARFTLPQFEAWVMYKIENNTTKCYLNGDVIPKGDDAKLKFPFSKNGSSGLEGVSCSGLPALLATE